MLQHSNTFEYLKFCLIIFIPAYTGFAEYMVELQSCFVYRNQFGDLAHNIYTKS